MKELSKALETSLLSITPLWIALCEKQQRKFLCVHMLYVWQKIVLEHKIKWGEKKQQLIALVFRLHFLLVKMFQFWQCSLKCACNSHM